METIDCLVDDQFGLVRHLREVAREPGEPDFFVMAAETANLNTLNNKLPNISFLTGGIGVDRAHARTKAIGEAIERYSAANYSYDDLILSTFLSAPSPCVRPDQFALYTNRQYADPSFPYEMFCHSTPVRWVSALDLQTGTTALVPAAMVYLPYIVDQEAGESRITQQISTGLACHTDAAQASLSAICEVIERDAVAITWQAMLGMPQICLESLSPQNRDLVRRLQRPGRSITLLHLAMDHGVPVILSVMRSAVPDGPALAVAAAAHPSPEQAISKSLEELAQTWLLAQSIKSIRPQFLPGSGFEFVTDPESHAAFHCQHRNSHTAEVLFSSKTKVMFKKIRNISTGNVIRDLTIVVDRLKTLGHKVFLVDVTSEDVRSAGFIVVRAVIPGLHPLFMSHRFRALGGTRLWEVPQRLGFAGITHEQGDNPFPHPFA